MSKSLYMRVPDEVHAALLAVADEAGVTINVAANVVLAKAFGLNAETPRPEQLVAEAMARRDTPGAAPTP